MEKKLHAAAAKDKHIKQEKTNEIINP
jgi:hypothetical protein